MKYIISLSGGNNSLNCLHYCINKFGKENVVAIFADNNFESADLYKGLEWTQEFFDIKINIVKSTKYLNPVDCNKKRNLIWGSAVRCTEETKIIPIKNWIKEHYPNKDEYVMILGYNTEETKRMKKARDYQEKAQEYNLFFPAEQSDWKPISYVDWRDIYGFPEQSVYEKGGRSNNCNGGCFKMARQGWYILWQNDRPEFLKWVEYEKEIRQSIIANRIKKYGPDWENKMKTKTKDLNILRDKSLEEYLREWDSGIVPRFHKRSDGSILGKCKQNGTECGFSI